MLKSIITWSLVAPSVTTNFVIPNVQIINHKNELKFQADTSEVVNKTIIVDDFDEKNTKSEPVPHATSQDLRFKGAYNDTHFRIFMDSGGDKSLPPSTVGKTNDYIIGKGKKESWYDHLIPGITLDVTNYAENKTSFLKKYRTINFSYAYNYNFWNSKMGWSYKGGKDSPLVSGVKTYGITSTNTSRLIFEERDSSHANNESAKLVITQEWLGNTLNYNFYLSVSYNWKAGSTIKHASFASFTADYYSLIFVPLEESDKAVAIEDLEQSSEFTFGYHSPIEEMVDLDNQLKTKSIQADVKKAGFKTTCLFAYGYYGIQEVGGKTYILSIITRSIELGATDSSLILEGFIRTRTLNQIYQDNKYYFSYLNSINEKEEADSEEITWEYFGFNLKGFIYSPFIYTV